MKQEDKTYYYYQYQLGQNDISVEEMDIYENEELDKVSCGINNLGIHNFYMISDSNKKYDTFLCQISKILSTEVTAASHLYKVAQGKFYQFDHFWKEFDKNKENRSK